MKRKRFLVIFCVLVCAALLSACNGTDEENERIKTILTIASLIIAAASFIISAFLNYRTALINRFNKFSDYVIELDKLLISNPKLYYLYELNNKAEELCAQEEDKSKFYGFMFMNFNIFLNAYLQFIAPRILRSKRQKELWTKDIILFVKNDLVKKFWKDNKHRYPDKDFINFIDKAIIKGLPAPQSA